MDIHQYLQDKNNKLQDQRQSATASDIFKGLTIYITGHTVPPAAELMDLITKHGGKVCNFYSSKNSATHIVAESLTARKTELWANYEVAKPKWILESIARGRRLPWTDFRTIEPKVDERNWILKERARVNCLAPNFLTDYYKNSRLHFLSSRKRALRQELKQGKWDHTPLNGKQTILHVDFDSFFIAAVLKNRPELANKPVCASHGSDTSDVASCNYIARSFGVSNGMWVSRARKMCPDLVCLPYDFDAYRQASDALYTVLKDLEPDYICPVSVDEALVNVTNLLKRSQRSLEHLIDDIRSRVRAKTDLAVSVGAGPNVMLAKIALKLAKPDGIRTFDSEHDAYPVVRDLTVDKIPGIGHMTAHKLEQLGIKKVQDTQRFTLHALESHVGPAVAKKLFDAYAAQDTNDISTLNAPAKTVGVDVAWGVRLITVQELETFISSVVDELWGRLEPEIMVSSVSVKVYKMEKNEPFLPSKYMGCGLCDILNRTIQLDPNVTRTELCRIVTGTVRQLNINPLRFRGLGVHLKSMETPATTPKHSNRQKRISEFTSAPSTPQKRQYITLQPKRKFTTLTQMNNVETIDEQVFEALPDDIKQEIVRHADLHNVRLTSGSRSQARKKIKAKKPADEYMPIDFLGKITRECDMRAEVKRWVLSHDEGPYYEDALDFYQYIESVLDQDWNWLKAVSLIRWLAYQVDEHGCCVNWRHFVELVQARLNGVQSDEENLESSIQACTPSGSQA